MEKERAIAWISEHCVSSDFETINRIRYRFCTMKDGWIAVFEVDDDYRPLIQARDIAHARSYCSLREPILVPVTIL